MKKLLFIVLLFISTMASAQTFRITKHNVIKAKISCIQNDAEKIENFADSVFDYAKEHKAVKVKFYLHYHYKIAQFDTSKDFSKESNINHLCSKIYDLHSKLNTPYYYSPHGIAHYNGSIRVNGVTHRYHSTIRY